MRTIILISTILLIGGSVFSATNEDLSWKATLKNDLKDFIYSDTYIPPKTVDSKTVLYFVPSKIAKVLESQPKGAMLTQLHELRDNINDNVTSPTPEDISAQYDFQKLIVNQWIAIISNDLIGAPTNVTVPYRQDAANIPFLCYRYDLKANENK